MNEVPNRCNRCGAPRGGALGSGTCAACQLEDLLPELGTGLPVDGEATWMPGPEVQRFGGYELLEEIGRGGMGVIFRARQQGLERVVALKMLLAGEFADAKARERLLREARFAARLNHPGIVMIHDVGECGGRPYFAMEYVAGPNLAQVTRRGLLPVAKAAEYVEKLARAVHHAHEHGVIHRDLKPANVLLSPEDEPKLTDFGLTKSLVDPTCTIESAGSPNFMAPEQADVSWGATGASTDVYGLGAILYYLLTGRPPALGDTLTETLRAVVSVEPVAPGQLRPGMPRDLETIALKCLEKEPGRRYASAQEVAEDLARWRRQESILARPASGLERLGKWCRRRPLVAGLSVAILLALVLGLAGVTWQWREAETARRLQRRYSYAADMKAAQIALAQHNRGLARALLERYLPTRGEEDLRSIDWRHLWAASAGSEAATFEHPAMVKNAVLSPDGTWLATSALDGRVRIWDVATGRILREWMGPRVLAFRSLSVSPDGRLLAAIIDGGVRILRTLDWGVERELPGRSGLVEFSRDGRKLVTLGAQGMIWDVGTWKAVPVPRPSEALNGDRALLGVSGEGTAVAFCSLPSPDRNLAKTRIHFWRVGETQARVVGPDGPWVSLALSTDGRWLAAGDDQGFVQVWNLEAGESMGRFKAHPQLVYGLAFAPDGSALASGGNDQAIRLWDTQGWANLRTLQGHHKEVWSLNYSHDGRWIVSGSEDGTAKTWRATAQNAGPPELVLPPQAAPLGVLPDETTLVSEDPGERSTRFWDLTTGRLIRNWSWDWFVAEGCESFRFLPGRAAVVGVTRHGEVRFWRIPDGELIRRVAIGVTNVAPLNVAPDLGWLVGIVEGQRCLLKLDGSGSRIVMTNTAGFDCFSRDGRWHVCTRSDWGFEVRDLQDGRLLPGFEQDGENAAVSYAFSPDGRLMACGGWDADIRIWDVVTGRRVGPRFRGHLSAVLQVVFTADGRSLISEGGDKTVRIWSLATGQETLQFEATVSPSARDQLQSSWSVGKRWISLRDTRGAIRLRGLADEEVEMRR